MRAYKPDPPLTPLRTLYRLYRAWRQIPYMRFAQFLICAAMDERALYYMSDDHLVEMAEEFARANANR